MDNTSQEAPTPEAASQPRRGLGNGFDLFAHRGMIALLILGGLAGGYALIDTFFLMQVLPLGGMPWWPYALMIAVGAAVGYGLGRGAPLVEHAAMTLITTVVLGLAAYPAMLRVNSITGEAETVTYQPRAVGVFEHPEAAYPPVDLRGLSLSDYLEAHGTEQPHRFRLVEGELGFYQLDLMALYARTSAFYRRRDVSP